MPDLITIPIFPLPNVVLFPKTYLPLHIFEPRYRKMVKDAIQSERLIGMCLLQEGWEKDYYGNPAVFPVGCVGKIVDEEELPDGKFNIVLFGLSKFVIRKESFEKPYRVAQVQYTHYEGTHQSSLHSSHRDELLSVLHKFARHVGDQGQIQTIIETLPDDETLVHTFCSTLEFSTLEKQYLLESEILNDQCKRLIDLIQFQLHNKPSWVSNMVGSHRKN